MENSVTTERRLVDTLTLPNGLEVFFYDCSRKVAGDRWYVCLTVEIPIPVQKDHFRGQSDPEKAYGEFTQAFGDTYVFLQKKERNFIDEKEVQTLLQAMKDDFIKNNLSYVGKAQFPMLCIKKAYSEWKEQQKWKVLHEEAIRVADSGE
ncbi:hypothetical protein [Thermodesulforhabdus norvegica]|uniref:Uncharacterized protein n=1 Tax=Thermodesulforhabdus norvegica TaxID=39841 RepID=A0A1I4VY19_9BACT|nr:hypothetical protein [Thermodesulforhabdus norvegica]SFN05927.1 hypothetical protein SAMN05660836_02506 [Thermodesulforhabdus norvegica]